MAANPWKGIPYATPTQADINKKASGWKGIPFSAPAEDVETAPAPMVKQSLSLDPITQAAVADQQQGIKDLQGIALSRLENTPSRTDISPLLSLVDTWTGSSLAKGYKPGESAATGTEALQKSLETVQQRKGDISKLLENGELRSDAIAARKEAEAARQAQEKAKWIGEGYVLDDNGMPMTVASGGKADTESRLRKAQIENTLAMAAENRAQAAAAGKEKQALKTGVPGLDYVAEYTPTADDAKSVKKMSVAKKDFDTSIDNLKAAVGKHGLSVLPGQSTTDLANAYADLVIKAKNAAELGALSGPDMGLINQMIKDPTKLMTKATINKDDYLSVLENAKARADSGYRSRVSAYGYAPRGGAPQQAAPAGGGVSREAALAEAKRRGLIK